MLSTWWATTWQVAPDGALWFGTYGQVSRFDGETWAAFTTYDVQSITVGSDGTLWFGTSGGVSRYLPPD
jgi:ligand-binding sensor domain-containing protein